MARITAGSASVKGLDKLLNQFDKIAKTKIVEAGITEACLRVERDAKKNCVGLGGDGTLKASITHNVELHGDSVTGVVAAPLDYAVYVEFGTGLFAVHGDGSISSGGGIKKLRGYA